MSNLSTDPRYNVRHIKNIRIPMSDGVTLSSDLFLPDAPGKYPAVLNYIPYRKEDASVHTGIICNYFAERGFVGVIVDIRGTGESGGVSLDEYTLQEQLDGLQVIDWLSKQSWCNGNVGMWGASYSGFNSIQIAMHNPPALKAIIPLYATDDRYNDDVHYYGGCLIGIEQVLYPAMMVTMNALPPYQEVTGSDWANLWQQRLEGSQPWILNWFQHQTEDEYWKPGSLKTDYSSIKCPVFSIEGWADGYTNPVFHMLQNLKVPHKALIGPWIHQTPKNGIPGPNIDFLHEMCRWWAQWLRGEETGIMQEPAIALYIQEGSVPTPLEVYMPGKWRFLNHWPPEDIQERSFFLTEGYGLSEKAVESSGADNYRYQATVGTTAGVWCAVNGYDSLTRDQSADDGRSLTYTSPVLEDPMEILGAPKAILHASSTAEEAFFCVKINDIAPDGSSRLVCRGILNATHRQSHAKPEPLMPGEVVGLEIPVKYISWTFKSGHRIRVAISSSDFPWVWPSPYPAVNTVYWGENKTSHIILPVVTNPVGNMNEFHLPEVVPEEHEGSFFGNDHTWQFTQDIIRDEMILRVSSHSKNQLSGTSYTIESDSQAEFGSSDYHPEETYADGLCKTTIMKNEEKTEVIGHTSIRSTRSNFLIDIEMNVKKGDETFFSRKWTETFPRNLL